MNRELILIMHVYTLVRSDLISDKWVPPYPDRLDSRLVFVNSLLSAPSQDDVTSMIPRNIDVAGLERRALRAWPALHTQYIGGWACRASLGYTKRANSMTPLEPTSDFTSLRPAFERFALDHGIPCTIRITPLAPPETDEACAQAGYKVVDPSVVMALPSLRAIPPLPLPNVRHMPTADTAWLEGYASSSRLKPDQARAHEAILAAVEPEATFTSISSTEGGSERAVAVGYAVLDEGMIGLFDILVDEAYRGRGLGKSVVLSLLAWGKEKGATGAYLQVVERNVAATRLYEAPGFEHAYRYHYRQCVLRSEC